jgi:hypothetical protein
MDGRSNVPACVATLTLRRIDAHGFIHSETSVFDCEVGFEALLPVELINSSWAIEAMPLWRPLPPAA